MDAERSDSMATYKCARHRDMDADVYLYAFWRESANTEQMSPDA